jgi:site-specific recombinase XerD
VLGSFAKWAVKYSRLEKNPMDLITLPPFGLRRVLAKGGHETTVPLPEVARAIVSEYLATERPGAAASESLFLVQYRWYGGEKKTRRMSGQRVWKIIKDLGKRVGVDTIHPHAFRHACAVELLKRSGGKSPGGAGASPSRRHPDDDYLHAARAARSPRVVNLFDEKNGGGTA